jgi:DNA-binding NarL/FixJ family response regulator
MSEEKNIRVVLADDHTLVREGIRALLEKVPSVTVVAEAADGREALALVRTHVPDIVVMDVAMAGGGGLEATDRILKEFPGVRVIILSMYSNEEYVLQALQLGASGYLLKNAASAELNLAIAAVARGDTFLSPAISRCVVDDRLRRSDLDNKPSELTPRQREILQMIAEGKSTKEIAFLLNLSIKTVDAHRAQMMERIGIHDVPGLVRYAMRIGLVPPESPDAVNG